MSLKHEDTSTGAACILLISHKYLGCTVKVHITARKTKTQTRMTRERRHSDDTFCEPSGCYGNSKH